MEKVNIKYLTKKLNERLGYRYIDTLPAVEKRIVALFHLIEEELAAGKMVMIKGFGSFRVKTRKGRKGIDPRTLKVIDIPDAPVIKYISGSRVKRLVRRTEEERKLVESYPQDKT